MLGGRAVQEALGGLVVEEVLSGRVVGVLGEVLLALSNGLPHGGISHILHSSVLKPENVKMEKKRK